MSNTVRLALIGCGGISNAHANGYKDLFERGCREFRVTACCDPVAANAQALAAKIAAIQGSEPRIFRSVDEVIAAGCADAADVCAPHYAHHAVALPLLAAGIHVLVEKPVGLTVRASRVMMAAARRAKRILATAEQVRRGPAARACRWAIREKKIIGDVRTAVIQSIDNNRFDYANPAFKWRGVKVLGGGGMIMDSGAHFGDMMVHLFGEPEELCCTMQTHAGAVSENAPILGTVPVDVEDAWQITIRFAQGPIVTWNYSRTSPGMPLRNAVYYGSKGTMRDLGFPFHCFQSGAETTLADGTVIASADLIAEYMGTLKPKEKEALFPFGTANDFAIEIYDFIRAVRTGTAVEMDGLAGLKAKALCEACFESATLGGRPVRYASVLNGRVRAFQAPIDAYWNL